MNLKKFISIIVLILMVSGIAPNTFVNAQEDEEQTEAEIACRDKYPEFDIDYNNLIMSVIEDPEADIDLKTVSDFLEDQQVKYHEYVQCIFDFAEDQILDSGGAKTRGTAQANAPSFPWFKPEAACISEDKKNAAIKASAPDQLLPPLLEIQREYSDMLEKIVPIYNQEGTEKDENGESLGWSALFSIKSNATEQLKNYIESEINNSMIAIDVTFTTIKELRMAFIMHVQFQCMLNNLEKYRKLLESIRTIVSCMPADLRDASMTK